MSVEGELCKLNQILKTLALFFIIILIFSITLGVNVANFSILNKASASSEISSTGSGHNNSVWEENDIGSNFVAQDKIIIGEGRNDGIKRVYSADGISGSGNIYEYSFNNGKWEKRSIIEDNSDDPTVVPDVNTVYGLEFGDFRNDGMNRIYSSGYNLAEYNFDSGSWLGYVKGPDQIQWTNDMVLGDARNDGNIRMYVAGWGEIYEVSYNHGDWDSIKIDTGGQRVEELFVTDGRNDGIFRLYAAINEHIYEYTWSGGKWEAADCGAIGDEPYILSCDMYGGDARNDGENRVYLAAGGLYELSYNGKNWDSIVITDSNKISAVTIGTGNNGVNHLYTGSSTGIGEYAFSNGVWKKTANYDTKYKVNDLAVGQGRDDEINRIYAAGDDNHIYEYSFAGNAEGALEEKGASEEEVTSGEEATPTETETTTETPTIEKPKIKLGKSFVNFFESVVSNALAEILSVLILAIGSFIIKRNKSKKSKGFSEGEDKLETENEN